MAYVDRTSAAALLTEFGATNSASDLRSMLALADGDMIPWLEWAYCGCGDPTTTSGPGTTQAIVVDPHRPPTPANRESGTLDALVEPYPQVIAGTPVRWNYDRTTRTLSARYTTSRVSGRGRFASGSLTEIATPALVYGGRYAVAVAGGAIVSRRGASILSVASCPRARTISVTVRPEGRNRSSCKIKRQ